MPAAERERASPGTPEGQRGFALLAALWLLSAAALILASLAVAGRSDRLEAENQLQEVRARAAARAGLAHALALLSSLQDSAEFAAGRQMAGFLPEWNRLSRISAALNRVRLPDGSSYSVTFRDPTAKLPLNGASETELARLLTALGVRTDRVLVVSQSIMDWRDPDGLHRPDGAEWDDYYRNLSSPVHPANGPFTSLAELRLVRGIDPQLSARLDSLLRVFPEGPVNLNAAPAPVLRALPGLDEEAVGAILGGRSAGAPIRSLLDLESRVSATSRGAIERSFDKLAPTVSFEPGYLIVTSRGRAVSAGSGCVIHALVERTPGRVGVVWFVIDPR